MLKVIALFTCLSFKRMNCHYNIVSRKFPWACFIILDVSRSYTSVCKLLPSVSFGYSQSFRLYSTQIFSNPELLIREASISFVLDRPRVVSSSLLFSFLCATFKSRLPRHLWWWWSRSIGTSSAPPRKKNQRLEIFSSHQVQKIDRTCGCNPEMPLTSD